MPQPPPRQPFQGPVPIPIQMQRANVPPPPLPGPTPTPTPTTNPRQNPRIVINTGITLPPGYTLPPGWAVIPAHNVQIIPPTTTQQTPTGVQTIPSPTHQVVIPGSAPNGVGSPGDVTRGGNSTNNLDHVAVPSGNPGPGSEGINNLRSTANVSSTPTSSTGIPTMIHQPPQIPGGSGGFWANRSQHPQFPLAVPLFPPPQSRSVQLNQTGVSTFSPPQSTERRESEERITALTTQLNESVKAMQDLVSKMSSIVSAQEPRTRTQTNALSAPNTPTFRPSTSNGSSPSSPPIHIPRRRSLNHAHKHYIESSSPPPQRRHRLSGSEDDLMAVDRTDIRAPWVDHPTEDDCVPFQEVGSPPRRRSLSQSPSRMLRRRPSLLRNEITDEMLDDRARKGKSMQSAMDGETQVDRTSVDKGKGKEVMVEDVPESD